MDDDQSILYVDVENLQDMAKQVIVSAISSWPVDFPKPDMIRLYVKADQTELWKIWANHNLPTIEISIKGVQHYASDGSKNSADISLALDVAVDVLKTRTKYVAVLSDDSDFAALFAFLKQEAALTQDPRVPFKWFMTDRIDTRSKVLGGFFPSEYVHVVTGSAPLGDSVVEDKEAPATGNEPAGSEMDAIARLIIQNTPVGSFKSADCKKLIAKRFPNNPLAKMDSATFGMQFARLIWPILEQYGAQLPNPSRKPRKYEMTEEAKRRAAS